MMAQQVIEKVQLYLENNSETEVNNFSKVCS